MNEHFREKYGLVKDVDTWTRGNQEIIAMAGVYKIVEFHDIEFHFGDNLETRDGEGVALKVTAVMEVEGHEKRYTMFGEANKSNCKVPYYWAMALNRGKARAALMLIGVYGKQGYYMEEEADAFEKKKPTIKEIEKYLSLIKDANDLHLLNDTQKAYYRENDNEIRNNLTLWLSEVAELEDLLSGYTIELKKLHKKRGVKNDSKS